MGVFTLLALALGLAMDAFAVSISNGMSYCNIGKKEAFATALCFGTFQGLMPILGYMGGRFFVGLISTLDHWIALILLVFIGGCMIWETFREWNEEETKGKGKRLTAKDLLLQGVATSIDALAVGISLAALDTNIVMAAAFIAIATFILCLIGAVLGKHFGVLLGKKAKLVGGAILIGIGLRIFSEHMF